MLPPTTYEQRAPLYEDVEVLLSPGFLSHPVVINGVTMHLRSLGPGDLFMLKTRATGQGDYGWKLWTVASSVWMVDGNNLLGCDHAVPVVFQRLRHLPHNLLDVLFYAILGLFSRASDAVSTLDVYRYENISRFKWKTLGPSKFHGTSGVPGVEVTGLNTVQRIWAAYNEIEDQRIKDDVAWEGAKLAASAQAPKAVEKIDRADRQRRQEEEAKHQAALDTFFYKMRGVIALDGRLIGQEELGTQISGVKSVEDLENEFRRWVTKDYDEHDRIVAAYKQRIMDKYEAEKRARAERVKAIEHERLRREAAGFKDQALVGYTPDQLQAILDKRGDYRPGLTTVVLGPPARDRVYEKYLDGDETPGELVVQGDKVIDPKTQPADVRRFERLAGQGER